MDQVCHRLVLAQIRPSFRPGAPKIISTLRPLSVIVPTKKSYSLLSRGTRWAEYRPTRSMKRNPWFPRSHRAISDARRLDHEPSGRDRARRAFDTALRLRGHLVVGGRYRLLCQDLLIVAKCPVADPGVYRLSKHYALMVGKGGPPPLPPKPRERE